MGIFYISIHQLSYHQHAMEINGWHRCRVAKSFFFLFFFLAMGVGAVHHVCALNKFVMYFLSLHTALVPLSLSYTISFVRWVEWWMMVVFFSGEKFENSFALFYTPTKAFEQYLSRVYIFHLSPQSFSSSHVVSMCLYTEIYALAYIIIVGI